jgi:Kef-type K+ transport system membrane component KefB
MPISQSIFILACLVATWLMRRTLGSIIPSVFLHLFLGIMLGIVVNTNIGPSWLFAATDNATLQPIGLMGWLGILLLMALGPSDTSNEHAGPASARQTLALSVVGFGGTFLCASGIGYLLGVMQPQLQGAAAEPSIFAMAIGLACAVTALPVLVSLLNERGEDTTPLGRLAIRVAIVDDVWMWLLLIFITSVTGTGSSPGVYAAKVLVLVAGSRLLLRPALHALSTHRPHMSHPNCLALGICVIISMALLSEVIGTHALFGAFLAGWNLPPSIARTLRSILLPVVQTLLVPFFFIIAGLKTNMSFSAANFIYLALGFTVMGIVLKMVFAALGARLVGLPWAQAFRLGSLLQCKGLMEIVALGIMRDANVIGPEVYSALIVMALTCTALTAPLHSLVLRINSRRGSVVPQQIVPLA